MCTDKREVRAHTTARIRRCLQSFLHMSTPEQGPASMTTPNLVCTRVLHVCVCEHPHVRLGTSNMPHRALPRHITTPCNACIANTCTLVVPEIGMSTTCLLTRIYAPVHATAHVPAPAVP